MKRRGTLFSVFALVAMTSAARANQSVVFGGPIGATDVNNALLPPKAGVYLGWTELWGPGNRAVNAHGDAEPVSAYAILSALYVMYKYPFHILGGGLASGFQLGYSDPGYLITEGLGKPYQRVVGWKDLYVDFLNWSRYVGPVFGERNPTRATGVTYPYGLTLKAEYSMIFPTGPYCSCQAISPGGNTVFFIPNVAATYFTPDDRFGGPFESDLHLFYDAQGRNPANDYSDGALIDLDFAFVQHFRPFALGITGAYALQVQDDSVGPAGHRNRVTPDGDRVEEFSLGPIVTFPIPQLRAEFKLKITTPIVARSTLPLSLFIANLEFPFP